MEPLTPPDCDLRKLPCMLVDVSRLLDSDTFALASGDEFKAAFALWARSWAQVPAASLPKDERLLARMACVSLTEWRTLSPVALRGWQECHDGRLYHPVIAEKALEAWLSHLKYRQRSAAGHAKRYEHEFDAGPFEAARRRAFAMLHRLAPEVAAQMADLPQAAQSPATSSPPPLPGDLPQAAKTPAKGKGKGNNSRRDATPSSPDQEAWQRGTAVLVAQGRTSAPHARSLFGKLLKDFRLEARDLLPTIITAENSGTQDPQGYLTAAARAIGARRGGKAGPVVADWGEDEWRAAHRIWKAEGSWSAELGPEPGKPGCRVPAHILVEAAA